MQGPLDRLDAEAGFSPHPNLAHPAKFMKIEKDGHSKMAEPRMDY
jgi:hypothetical protein